MILSRDLVSTKISVSGPEEIARPCDSTEFAIIFDSGQRTMVDINANASQLQAQLQAQTRGNRDATALARGAGNVKPNAAALAEEKVRERQDQQAGQSRRLPVKVDDRVANLSSSEELQIARARVNAATGNTNREAPAGRTSERQNALRNQPLGQIIDIRV